MVLMILAYRSAHFEQKQRFMGIAQEMVMTFNEYPNFLKNLITDEES